MSVDFDVCFYVKTPFTEEFVKKTINCLIGRGVRFEASDDKTNYPNSSNRRCTLAINEDFDEFDYVLDKLLLVKEKDGQNPKIENCIKLISKYGQGTIPVWYKNIQFELYFNNIDPRNDGYIHISLSTTAPSQFTTSANSKKNLEEFLEVTDILWKKLKPFYAEGGTEIERNIKKIEKGNLEEITGAIIYFCKKLVDKIGKNKISKLADAKTKDSIQEFEDGDLRIIRYDVAGGS